MKRIDLIAYGEPRDVARCVDVPDVGAPQAGEAVFEVLASPINPADLIFARGAYALRPPLPATPGAECVGRVIAVGAGVSNLVPGDLVVTMQRDNWVQKRRLAAEDLIPLPAGIDIRQAAMLRVNPATANLMLRDFVDLAPGDWVAQNVANSGVGRMLIAQARERGLRTVNIVRRQELVDELGALGADICLVDGPDLPARVSAATAGAAIRLSIDAVGGAATARMSAIAANGGTVCLYGSMSGEEPVIFRGELVYRGVNFVGFMLGRALAQRSRTEVLALYAEIAAKVHAGLLHVPVERVYPIEEIGAALVHAERTRPGGKILIAPNGMV